MAKKKAPLRKRAPEKRRITIYRSSKTGRTVTAEYARKHPATTERQRVRVHDELPGRRR